MDTVVCSSMLVGTGFSVYFADNSKVTNWFKTAFIKEFMIDWVHFSQEHIKLIKISDIQTNIIVVYSC